MKRSTSIFVAIFIGGLLILVSVIPLVAEAQTCEKPGGLVPCGRLCDDPDTPRDEKVACQICDIFELIDRIWKFILTVLMPGVAIVLYIAAGILILLYGANPGLQATGKSIFKTTTWGVIIILAAWMLTNTVMRSLAGDSIDRNAPWYVIQCGNPAQPAPPSTQRYSCNSLNQCVPNASGQYTEPACRGSTCQQTSCVGTRRCSGNECRNSPGVTAILSCMNTIEGVNVRATTFDLTHSACSCHFGGRSCTDGSHAIDYGRNALNQASPPLTLEQAKEKVERCGTTMSVSVACFYEDSSGRRLPNSFGANHIHCNVNNAACGCN